MAIASIFNLTYPVVEGDPKFTNRLSFYPNMLSHETAPLLIQQLKYLGYDFVFSGNITTKKLMLKKNKQSVIVIDKYGREKLNLGNAKIIDGDVSDIVSGIDKSLSSDADIAPQVYLLNELKLVDFSGLTSKSHIIDAVKKELESFSKACVIIESKK